MVANEIRKLIVDEINEDPFFLVMVEVCHKDIMSIVIKTVNDEGEIRIRLVPSVECADKTEHGIAGPYLN